MGLKTIRGTHGYAVEGAPRDATVQRESAGFVAPGQSAVNFTGKVATSATVTTTVPLIAPPTGKLYIVTDLYGSYDDTNVHDTRFQITNGTDTMDVIRAPIKGDTSPLEMPGIETQMVVPQGWTLQVLLPISTGAPNFYFNVCGTQQNVGIG